MQCTMDDWWYLLHTFCACQVIAKKVRSSTYNRVSITVEHAIPGNYLQACESSRSFVTPGRAVVLNACTEASSELSLQ